uniref:Uncharacterized protein n=1 Tax=Parascaris univalens TaxID=6257 RepID=A0A915AXB9_PARUN
MPTIRHIAISSIDFGLIRSSLLVSPQEILISEV